MVNFKKEVYVPSCPGGKVSEGRCYLQLWVEFHGSLRRPPFFHWANISKLFLDCKAPAPGIAAVAPDHDEAATHSGAERPQEALAPLMWSARQRRDYKRKAR